MPNDLKYLHLQEGDKVIRIFRLRYCDDVPVRWKKPLFPQVRLSLGDLTQPLFSTLSAHNIILKTGTKKNRHSLRHRGRGRKAGREGKTRP